MAGGGATCRSRSCRPLLCYLHRTVIRVGEQTEHMSGAVHVTATVAALAGSWMMRSQLRMLLQSRQ